MLEDLRDVVDALANKTLIGTDTIPAAGTEVTVTHGYGSTAYVAVATPLVDPTIRWWLDSKTATTFKLKCQSAAPGGGIPFDWIVKGA